MARKPVETPDEQSPAATNQKVKVSKADAVRAALAEGVDTPDEGIAFIQKRFGIEMDKPTWSSYKSAEKTRKAKAAGGDPPRVGRPPVHPPSVESPASTPPHGSAPNVAQSIEAIKDLVDTLGVEQVVAIAKLFGK
jgi:hypothetical protein